MGISGYQKLLDFLLMRYANLCPSDYLMYALQLLQVQG